MEPRPREQSRACEVREHCESLRPARALKGQKGKSPQPERQLSSSDVSDIRAHIDLLDAIGWTETEWLFAMEVWSFNCTVLL